MPRPSKSPQTRLTMARAKKGLSGLESHVASDSRGSRSGLMFSSGGAGAVGVAAGGEDLAGELVEGFVLAERLADPLVEDVDTLDAGAERVGAEEVAPLVGPVVGVVGVVQEAVDQFVPLVGRGVGKE